MLNKYSCQLQPRIDSRLFPYFVDAIGRRRILDKWFYFYINQPEKPVIIWKMKDSEYWQLQPGTNRYIGVALRNNKEWIDSVLVTDDTVDVPEIRNLELIDSNDLEIEDYQITLSNQAHAWGIGNQTLYDPAWIQPVYDWIHSNLKYRWGLEYNGQVYYVNSERKITSLFKKTKEIVYSKNYASLQLAVEDLFKKIKLHEF